jgi:hypothetical protein
MMGDAFNNDEGARARIFSTNNDTQTKPDRPAFHFFLLIIDTVMAQSARDFRVLPALPYKRTLCWLLADCSQNDSDSYPLDSITW